MPRAGLTPERIIRQAAAVADETGLDRLTLAAVAQRCGVSLPGLYKHVSGLEEVRRGIALLAVRELADVRARAAAGVSGTDALRAISAAYRVLRAGSPGPLRGQRAGARARRRGAYQGRDPGIRGDQRGPGGLPAGRPRPHPRRAHVAGRRHGMATLQTAGGFGLPESVEVTFGHLVDALDTEFRRLGAIG